MAQFKPGQSGNLKGRPKGNRTAAQIRKMLEVGAGEVVQKIKEQALASDPAAQKIWIDRICPKVKPVDRIVKLPGFPGPLRSQRKAT